MTDHRIRDYPTALQALASGTTFIEGDALYPPFTDAKLPQGRVAVLAAATIEGLHSAFGARG